MRCTACKRVRESEDEEWIEAAGAIYLCPECAPRVFGRELVEAVRGRGGNPDFVQGWQSGRRWIGDVLYHGNEWIGVGEREGQFADMIEMAAEGWVPPDVMDRIAEVVPAEARYSFELGFRAACRDWVGRRDIGMSEN